MVESYGMMGKSNEKSGTETGGNGVRQLFKTFDYSRQMDKSAQYGLQNQNDFDAGIGIYNTFFGGDTDDE